MINAQTFLLKYYITWNAHLNSEQDNYQLVIT